MGVPGGNRFFCRRCWNRRARKANRRWRNDMNRLVHVYAALSHFAERPHRFRAEFRDEMQGVFAAATAEAANMGRLTL